MSSINLTLPLKMQTKNFSPRDILTRVPLTEPPYRDRACAFAMNSADALERLHRLPCFQGDLVAEPLKGGITNHNFLVKDRRGRYVARLGGDIWVHGVLRPMELAASRAAYQAGISPEVIYSEPGVVVFAYIEGQTLTPELLRAGKYLEDVAELVRRCHTQIPLYLRGPALMFWVFHVIRGYAAELTGQKSAWVPELPGLLEQSAVLEREVGPVEIVFGHNDLLAANIMDDGKRLWLIDWDYAGFNSPLFDLGGLASNNGLSAEQEMTVLERYLGRAPGRAFLRSYLAMKCASLMREAMWSMVSEIHSGIAFDFASYTRENLDRYRRAYAALREGPSEGPP